MGKDVLVISLGGSMIVPDKINSQFLLSFKKLAEKLMEKHKLIVICGGGKTARKYQDGAKEVGVKGNNKLDWIGIRATHINAEIVKAMFGPEIAEDELIFDPTKENLIFEKDMLIGGGWKPGFSTDYDAVILAERFGAKKLVNLSNVEYVYDKDPRKFNDAKKIEKMTWSDLRAIVGDEWSPGLNAPFDPIAAKKSQELSLLVAIIKGDHLDSIIDFVEEKDFHGTLISGN